jgi:alpha-glucosidase
MAQKFLVLIFLFVLFESFGKPIDNFRINSPDGTIDLSISLVNNKLNYHVNWSGQMMVGMSDLEIFPNSAITVFNSKVIAHDSIWNTVWDQFSSVRDNYKQLEMNIVSNKVKGKLLARVYDSGVAFRFVLEDGAKPKEAAFLCSYKLPEGSTYYAPMGESQPLGPIDLKGLNEYTQSKDGGKTNISVPLVVETSSHSFMALLESDLYVANGFQSMNLGVNLPEGKVESRNLVELSGERLTTPWRVILLGKSAGDLVVNTTTINLASPCKLENTNWIKPGKTLWDWRVHGYTSTDGFTYSINTESYMRFIDFAASTGIEYFMIDADWFTKVTKGHFEVNEKLDLPKIINYAKTKKVDILLYYDRQKGDFGDEELFSYYHSLGVKGIKYGFMGNNVPFTKEAIRRSAESKLLIDFHDGPVPFSGVHQTFPNAISREYCHAQQDSRRAFTPETFIKMALVNAITGPLDMNNGNFDLTGINSGVRLKGPREKNSYFSTVTCEAARTLIIFSGLVCIPDAPEAYAAKKDLFEFIQKLPVGKWDESRILNSKIGEYITTARRHGKEWFIGSVINQQGGTLDIKLDFLDANQEYEVTYYEDTKDTNCKTNPEAYQVRKGTVKKGDVIKAVLAPGGGHCMWIRPKTKK